MPVALIIDRCLQKDPKQRYASTGELALALLPFARRRAHSSVAKAVARVKTGGLNPNLQMPSSMPPPPNVAESGSGCETASVPRLRAPSFPPRSPRRRSRPRTSRRPPRSTTEEPARAASRRSSSGRSRSAAECSSRPARFHRKTRKKRQIPRLPSSPRAPPIRPKVSAYLRHPPPPKLCHPCRNLSSSDRRRCRSILRK